jgi:Xaa-Pro aminopeptidase
METIPTPTETELNIKLWRIHNLLEQFGLDALLLRQTSNFSWATCGADSHINTAESFGNASLLITPTSRYVLTNNIEAPRLTQEEKLVERGWEFQVSPWFNGKDRISELANGMKLGADTYFPNALDLSDEIAQLRFQLTDEEGKRFSALGKSCADGMQQAIHAVRPGMTEYEIAGVLSQAVESRGVQAIVNLIATDERIFSYRHPIPTSKQLQRYAMLILCGRKWGLICSLTRLVHFGKLPDEVRDKGELIARIDAKMIAATRPNNTLGNVFHIAQSAYRSAGFPNEWQSHHQGGSAGYAPREVTATPLSTEPILLGQAFAWNPSITGVKSEDTILVGEHTNEILTEMRDWPTIDVQINDQIIRRPTILEKGS